MNIFSSLAVQLLRPLQADHHLVRPRGDRHRSQLYPNDLHPAGPVPPRCFAWSLRASACRERRVEADPGPPRQSRLLPRRLAHSGQPQNVVVVIHCCGRIDSHAMIRRLETAEVRTTGRLVVPPHLCIRFSYTPTPIFIRFAFTIPSFVLFRVLLCGFPLSGCILASRAPDPAPACPRPRSNCSLCICFFSRRVANARAHMVQVPHRSEAGPIVSREKAGAMQGGRYLASA